MAEMVLAACDPGLKGGFAAMALRSGDRPELLDAVRMPLTREKGGKDVVDAAAVRALLENWAPDACLIERVSAMPRQGVASSFNFGVSTGVVRGLMIASGAQFEDVTPAAWKRALGLTSDKRASVGMARALFPAVLGSAILADEGRCEAALMAWWRAKQWAGS